MDARLDPAKYAGLAEGDAHVIRNAGGRATDDAIRSLVISHKLLGTRTWLVVHHTNCGMELFTDQVMGDLLEDDLGTASFDGAAWSNPQHRGGHAAGHFIKWHTIANQERACCRTCAGCASIRWFRRDPDLRLRLRRRARRLNEVQAASRRPRAGE